MIRSVVIGCGSYTPAKAMKNAEFEEFLETSDEWIVQRTGIEQRHIAAEGETTADLAEHAARAALENAGIGVDGIDLIILATSTPDNTFPATAVEVQHRLGMKHGQAKRILVIGAETFSRILDWKDRTTCVLFGDGAGAVVLEAKEGAGTSEDQGILTCQIRSDGSHKDKLYVDGGPSSTQTTGFLRMEGKEVFRHAVGMITDVIIAAYDATGLNSDDLD
ncbi:3-oxoacyl-[acyl-carrier-protein] synthase 3 [Nymphon striatum]|nr:3-oxoacyl-[acyl-carrier-protein] synthase 3 [Nymphon striatum]